MTSSWQVEVSLSTAAWARSGSAIRASHSFGSRFETSTVAALWWFQFLVDLNHLDGSEYSEMLLPTVWSTSSGCGYSYHRHATPDFETRPSWLYWPGT
jgi:hypothetical protein